MSKKVASLENISKTYGKEDLTVKALDSINLEIYKGDYLAVMGASGSGTVSYTHLTLPTIYSV